MRRRIVLTLASVMVLSGVVGAPPATSGPADAGQGTPLRYVAMGDSFSAGSGILPPDPAAFPLCLRSIRNYPNVIADRVGAELTDVTCGAAQTRDYFDRQYPPVAPQLQALSRRTELVTMTIGGNDNDVFIGAIIACGTAGLVTLGRGSPCKDQFGASFENTVRTKTYPSLVRSLHAVHRRAPRAEVAIIGYPWLLPAVGGCYPTVPVARGDVPYVRRLQATLNHAVRRAAAATGTTYVNMNKVSQGHDACQPPGTRWIVPPALGDHPVLLHPNALGEARMATRTIRVLGLR